MHHGGRSTLRFLLHNVVSLSIVVLAQIQQRLEPQLIFQTIRAAARFVLARIRAEVNAGEAILDKHAELFAGIAQPGAHLRHEAFRGFL